MSGQGQIVSILFNPEDTIKIHAIEANTWKEALIIVLESYLEDSIECDEEEDMGYKEAIEFVRGASDNITVAMTLCQVQEGWWFNVVSMEHLV